MRAIDHTTTRHRQINELRHDQNSARGEITLMRRDIEDQRSQIEGASKAIGDKRKELEALRRTQSQLRDSYASRVEDFKVRLDELSKPPEAVKVDHKEEIKLGEMAMEQEEKERKKLTKHKRE